MRSNKSSLKFILSVLAAFSLLSSYPPSATGVIAKSDSDWLIECTSVELKNYNDPQLSIKPVLEEKVVCIDQQSDDLVHKPYEDLWYGTTELGSCFGVRRCSDLEPPENCHHVEIQVLFSNSQAYSQAQQKSPAAVNASADTVLRIAVDCLLKDVWIKTVVVPDECFDDFLTALSFYELKIPDAVPAVGSTAWGFNVQTLSGSRSVVVQHN